MGAERFRAARMEHLLDRKEVAADLGISLEMVRMLELGKRLPSLTLAATIHRYFEIPNAKLGVK